MNGNSNQYMTCFTSPVTFEVIWDDGAAHDAAWRMRDGDQMPANLHSTPGFWPIGPRQLKDLKGHRESARHAGSRFRALRQKSLELRQKSTESAWICLTSETSLCWCVFFTLEDIDHWVEGLNISDFSSFGLCVLFSVQSTVRREHIIFPSSWVLKALGVGRCFLDGNWEEGYV